MGPRDLDVLEIIVLVLKHGVQIVEREHRVLVGHQSVIVHRERVRAPEDGFDLLLTENSICAQLRVLVHVLKRRKCIAHRPGVLKGAAVGAGVHPAEIRLRLLRERVPFGEVEWHCLLLSTAWVMRVYIVFLDFN